MLLAVLLLLIGTSAGPAAAQPSAGGAAAPPGGGRIALRGGQAQLVLVDVAPPWNAAGVALRAQPLARIERDPDGRHALVGTRDGWVQKVDLVRAQVVAEARAGEALHDFALAADGRFVLAAAARDLVLLDADLQPQRRYRLAAADGSPAAQAGAAVRASAVRRSFVVAPAGLRELWEISVDPHAEDIYDGLVHDFRMREGVARPGYLGVRRTKLAAPAAAIWLDAPHAQVLALPAADGAADPRAPAAMVNLDVRRAIGEAPQAAALRPDGAAAAFVRAGRVLVAGEDRAELALVVIDAERGTLVAKVPLAGRPAVIRAHANSPWIWVAVAPDASGAPDTLVGVDQATLRVAQIVPSPKGEPSPGWTDLAFDDDGRHLIAASARGQGFVFDAASGRELARHALPR
jgi:hypothetical protein